MELPTLVFLKGAPRAEPGMITGLPDKCHYEECDTRVMAGIAWDEIARYDTSLTMLEVAKLDMPNATFLTHLVNLRELLIRDSTLEALPADLTRLTALQILQVRATPVMAVPSVGHLISLGSLLLQSNRITEIPNSFKALTKLTYVKETKTDEEKRSDKSVIRPLSTSVCMHDCAYLLSSNLYTSTMSVSALPLSFFVRTPNSRKNVLFSFPTLYSPPGT